MERQEAADPRDEPGGGEARGAVNGQDVADHAAREPLARPLDPVEGARDRLEVLASGVGERDGALGAVKEADAEMRLEVAQPVTDRRRGQRQLVRRPGDASMPGNGLERFESAQGRQFSRHR